MRTFKVGERTYVEEFPDVDARPFIAGIRLVQHIMPDDYGLDYGWGNGYVDLLEGHPLWDIEEMVTSLPVSAPGGITGSWYDERGGVKVWRIGFDTLHAWDGPYLTRDFVLLATLSLFDQCSELDTLWRWREALSREKDAIRARQELASAITAPYDAHLQELRQRFKSSAA